MNLCSLFLFFSLKELFVRIADHVEIGANTCIDRGRSVICYIMSHNIVALILDALHLVYNYRDSEKLIPYSDQRSI